MQSWLWRRGLDWVLTEGLLMIDVYWMIKCTINISNLNIYSFSKHFKLKWLNEDCYKLKWFLGGRDTRKVQRILSRCHIIVELPFLFGHIDVTECEEMKIIQSPALMFNWGQVSDRFNGSALIGSNLWLHFAVCFLSLHLFLFLPIHPSIYCLSICKPTMCDWIV